MKCHRKHTQTGVPRPSPTVIIRPVCPGIVTEIGQRCVKSVDYFICPESAQRTRPWSPPIHSVSVRALPAPDDKRMPCTTINLWLRPQDLTVLPGTIHTWPATSSSELLLLLWPAVKRNHTNESPLSAFAGGCANWRRILFDFKSDFERDLSAIII